MPQPQPLVQLLLFLLAQATQDNMGLNRTKGCLVIVLLNAALSHAQCRDTCQHASNNYCDDGGIGSEYSSCTVGTDCSDWMRPKVLHMFIRLPYLPHRWLLLG